MPISGRKRRLATSALFGAAILGLAVASYADPPGEHPGMAGHDESVRNGRADRRDRPEHSEHPDDDTGRPERLERLDHPNAGLHLGWEHESPEQRAARITARQAFERQIVDAVRRDGKEVTGEERELIRMQWRRHARLWKIRELAEAVKDNVAVQKCDQLLAHSDAWLVHRLQELNAKAPVRGAK